MGCVHSHSMGITIVQYSWLLPALVDRCGDINQLVLWMVIGWLVIQLWVTWDIEFLRPLVIMSDGATGPTPQ